ncbi:hypothetical protein DCAR_0205482 [Daucus carota subsp. sativus]|uniref:Uncharacterized protein n=1 Tax=Daucus carota subsp. sativus TaxID=79200 RepID=A0AAF1AN63_DAUCS|nr:hypothetical protein DCAR_0205482 [Daucus carota subsp. sativus]
MFDCTGRRFQNVEVGPNAEAKKFYRLVEEGKKPLYPGCTNFSMLSFIIRLYRLKCVHGITESGFSDLLILIKEAFPEANVPISFTATKNIIKDLGLDYQKIHACPNSCMFDKKNFNGAIETRQSAEPLTGTEVEQLLFGYKNQSIFFDLPYWKNNPLRHNLDVMHIEKNICDSILGTLLNISGKSKDHLAARFDLQEMGIRKSLHPMESADGKSYEINAALFDMSNKEKDIFCKVLKNAKLPYGCASNISRYVHTNEGKILGYKSHDAHFILHYLLQFAVKKSVN